MTVVYGDDEPSGLATMVGGLIEQNIVRDPSRRRLLRPAVTSITVPDVGVAITADSAKLLELTSAPLRFGLPDLFDPRGRAVLRNVVSRRVRIRGLLRHPRRLARLSALLSVA